MNAKILFASPKKNGDTAFLVDLFIKNFNGNCQIIDLFKQPITPCLDCDGCKHNLGCILKDDFNDILKDDYDVLVIASPIYMSNLPSPLLSVVSRFNFNFTNKKFLRKSLDFNPKFGLQILVGGGSANVGLMGKNNEDNAIKQADYIFKKLNITQKEIVLSLNTDVLPAKNDENAIKKIIKIAKSFN